MTTTPPPAIPRPNGRLYRPRSIRVQAWENDDWPETCGVIVLGTHDLTVARPLAEQWCRRWHGATYAIDPALGWWRAGYHYGRPMWFRDETRGAAGISWTASDEPEMTKEEGV